MQTLRNRTLGRRGALWPSLLILLAIAGWADLLPAAPPSEAAKPAEIRASQDEALLLSCINAERREKGLLPLATDPILVIVARKHSADMAARDYFSHLAPAPLPRTPLDRYALELGHPPRTVVGENLGCCDAPLMGLIHAGMMESREHRANILDREYVSVGVGVYVLPDGRAWVTQVFRGEFPKAPQTR